MRSHFGNVMYAIHIHICPLKKIQISKSRTKLATPVETPAKPQLSSIGFTSFDRVFSSGEHFNRNRCKTSFIYVYLPAEQSGGMQSHFANIIYAIHVDICMRTYVYSCRGKVPLTLRQSGERLLESRYCVEEKCRTVPVVPLFV